ncbi:hypothetical protein [Streptomyces sp. SM11]|uniref:hypothetical protein n=1 Tax=Streptomyces sp. SM11 TaxID=565557 RepID=UPI0035BC8586
MTENRPSVAPLPVPHRAGTSRTPSYRTTPPETPPYRISRARVVLRAVAMVSCLPYIALKIAWMAGSRLGIPDGSALLDGGTALRVANGATVLMDGAVIVLALLLTQSWGRRAPAWLLVLPMWVASGLLLPIMTGFPIQMAVRLFGGGSGLPVGEGNSEAFLDPWVFGVVYGGFIVQGLALGSLFALYARERWAHLWQGRLRDLPDGPTTPALRATAVAVALAALLPGVTHLLWVSGSTAGLNPVRAAARTSEFYVLEVVSLLFVVATVVGVLLLAFRRTGRLSLRLPLVLAWAGSAATACWGGWLSVAGLIGAGEAADRPMPATTTVYAVQVLAGALVVTLGAYFFAERAAASALPAAADAPAPALSSDSRVS